MNLDYKIKIYCRIKRLDVLKKINVPSSKNRKAYFYYRNTPYQEEAGGLFSSDGVDYDLNKIFRISHKKKVKNIPISDLNWILPFVPDEDIDRVRVARADLNAPIIVTRQENKMVVVDGVHRLKKAVLKGAVSIKGVFITPSELSSTKIKQK